MSCPMNREVILREAKAELEGHVLDTAKDSQNPRQNLRHVAACPSLSRGRPGDHEHPSRSNRTTDFQVSVGSRSLYNSVQLRGHLEPRIRLHSLGQQGCRAVHAKLEAIFDHRRLTIKNAIFRGPRWNAIFRLPGWLKWLAYVVILISPTLFSRVVAHIHSLSSVVRIGPTFFVSYWIVVAILGFIYFWPSRVSFVHSSSPSSAGQ
jgi:hypothetical protein